MLCLICFNNYCYVKTMFRMFFLRWNQFCLQMLLSPWLPNPKKNCFFLRGSGCSHQGPSVEKKPDTDPTFEKKIQIRIRPSRKNLILIRPSRKKSRPGSDHREKTDTVRNARKYNQNKTVTLVHKYCKKSSIF